MHPIPKGEGDFERAARDFHPNDHGARATTKHDSRGRHGRSPLPGPLPEGEGDKERLRRDFHAKDAVE